MIILVLGGASSGKSEFAERLTTSLPGPHTYMATWPAAGNQGGRTDDDMAARIARHRARRPPAWVTVEVGLDLAEVLRQTEGTVLVDSLGTWVAAAEDFVIDGGQLCSALRERQGDTVIVSDEVGLGVHPSTATGRRFREVVGALNMAVAAVADPVSLVVAGRVLPLEPATMAVAGGAARGSNSAPRAPS